MTKRSLVLIGVAAVLAFVYVAFFKDFFRAPQIEMIAQIRPTRGARPAGPGEVPVDPVSFAFDRKYAVTSIRVIAEADEKTNKYPHVLWHLITDSNSVPTKVLIYGQPPRGMKPKVPRARPEPLEPDVVYKIYVEAGEAKGEKRFHTRESVRPQ
jgi:hypothetical protein